MRNRVHNYIQKLIYWKNIIIFHKSQKPILQKIILTFSIRDLSSLEEFFVIKSLVYLEIVSNQKAFVKNSEFSGLKSKRKTINFLSQTTLRKEKMYYFFDFFKLIIIPNMKKKFLKINNKFAFMGNLTIIIKDLTIFPGLLEQAMHYLYPLKIDFVFDNSNNIRSKFFFKEIGLKF
jgi:ribosomal protein L5